QQTGLGGQCGRTMTKHGQGILRTVLMFPQAGWQPRMPAGQELLDALTGKGQGMSKSNACVVEYGRKSRRIEIPYRQESSLWRQQRIGRSGCQLAFNDSDCMSACFTRSGMRLLSHAQRKRILH